LADFKITTGNIFDSKADALVCPVNCVGVMGKGLALSFKRKFPGLHENYSRACEEGGFTIGSIHAYESLNRVILSLPTKLHWRNPSEVEYVRDGLKGLVAATRSLNIKSIALPMLGCGCGGLDFDLDVYPLMVDILSSTDLDYEIYVN
jgi:O-acetyl-ADP-ribose deacetylase (regulator of RNase III)